MQCTFHYAASSYLDEWLLQDQRWHQFLAFDRTNNISDEQGAESLASVAQYYRVIRNFRDIGEKPRMSAAYRILSAVPLVTKANRVDTVKRVAEELGTAYQGSLTNPPYLLSAASKFLWMRFRSPVLIYDSTVSARLNVWEYKEYCDKWMIEFAQCEKEIVQACEDLISFKQFTLACDLPSDTLKSWTSSQWFRERVFDHYQQIAYDLGQRINPIAKTK